MTSECNGALNPFDWGQWCTEPSAVWWASTKWLCCSLGRKSPRDAGKELSGMRMLGSNSSEIITLLQDYPMVLACLHARMKGQMQTSSWSVGGEWWWEGSRKPNPPLRLLWTTGFRICYWKPDDNECTFQPLCGLQWNHLEMAECFCGTGHFLDQGVQL